MRLQGILHAKPMKYPGFSTRCWFEIAGGELKARAAFDIRPFFISIVRVVTEGLLNACNTIFKAHSNIVARGGESMKVYMWGSFQAHSFDLFWPL